MSFLVSSPCVRESSQSNRGALRRCAAADRFLRSLLSIKEPLLHVILALLRSPTPEASSPVSRLDFNTASLTSFMTIEERTKAKT
jgi:hypothetical protein